MGDTARSSTHGKDSADSGKPDAIWRGTGHGASYLTAEISASAVRHNVSAIRSILHGETKICAVAKADCYGHGTQTLLDILAQEADQLSVATPTEALQLREQGYRGAILMFFSPCAFTDDARRNAIGELIARDVTLTLVAAEEVAVVDEAARRLGQIAEIHVKIDTGMGRSGVMADSARSLCSSIQQADGLRLTGIYTHFATADESDKQFAREQLRRFRRAVSACVSDSKLVLHAANSAATMDLPESHLDMVRPGIALYGYQPSDDIRHPLPLQPAMRVTAPLMQIKEVPAGGSCGYGLTHTFARPSLIGLVPVGYADGYLRCWSNRATMRLCGVDVPVCGRVSMDQTIVDITDLPGASVGETVEIISPDPDAPHSVESLASLAGTIP